MPKEKLHASCRRGGSRGEARGRVSVPLSSDSLSDDAKSARRRRGRRPGQAQAPTCTHSFHPSSRFSFPCLLDFDTYYVSVKIEKCEHEVRGQAAEEHRPPAPALDQPPLSPAQRVGPEILPPAPEQGQHHSAEPSTGAKAGPSAPVEDNAPHTDSSEPDPYACKVVEEVPSTSVDD